MNPGTGPGTSSYHLLTVLLAYAPNSEAQAAVAMRYNELVMQHGANTRLLDAALAKQIYTELLDGLKIEHRAPHITEKYIDNSRSPIRRSVKRHIEQALAELPVGSRVLVSDIVKFKSDEYGDGSPSAGAVSACLFDRDKKPRDLGNGIVGCLIKGKMAAHKVS